MALKIIWLSALLPLVVASSATLKFQALTNVLTETDNDFRQLDAILQDLLTQLKQQIEYENLWLFKAAANDFCPFVEALKLRNEPRLILRQQIENIKQRFPTQGLVLRCEPINWQESGLKVVQRGLRHVSFLNLKDFQNMPVTSETKVLIYCRMAFKAGISHVIVLLPDFALERRYFICYQYPKVEARRRFLATTKMSPTIFEPQYLNMQGAPLWTQPDLMPSRTMLYFDKQGKSHLMGYVANVVKIFAAWYNATLKFRFPVDFGKILHHTVLENAAQNGSLDIATSITYLLAPDMLERVSYPYDVIKYCIMMPMPKPIHRYEVFTHIISPIVLVIMSLYLFLYSVLLLYSIDRLTWTTACTNLEMVRAMFAQCFWTVRKPRLLTKFIIFQISYTCHLVNNMYSAFLQSYLTEQPSMSLAHTVEEARSAGLRVLIPASDLALLEGISSSNMNDLRTILQIENDASKYDRVRQSMDMNYIYPVSDRRWQVFEENQKFFQRRIFFYSDEECIRTTLLMCFPLRPDLPYRDLFDDFVLRMQAMGFTKRWTSLTFYWMTKFRYLQFKDPSVIFVRAEKALNLDDFRWLWIGYGCLIVFSILVFLLELFREHFCIKKYSRRE